MEVKLKMNIMYKHFWLLIFVLSFYCCNSGDNDIVLIYDYFSPNQFKKKSALLIKYHEESHGVRIVNCVINDSEYIWREKINSNGIFRSFNNENFSQTHSFMSDSVIESDSKTFLPFLLSQKTRLIKKYFVKGIKGDSSAVLFFDEVIPSYSFVSSYLLEKDNIFLVFYDQQDFAYYRLASAVGLSDNSSLVSKTDSLLADTTFFGKYYKLPLKKAPPVLR